MLTYLHSFNQSLRESNLSSFHSLHSKRAFPPLLYYAINDREKVCENISLKVTYIVYLVFSRRVLSFALLTAVQGATASMRRSCNSALSLIQSLPDH